MANTSRSFSDIRTLILSAHENTGIQNKIDFYNDWAESYEQDVALLDYQAPYLAAECIVTHFTGDRKSATILDVACGSGLVSVQLKKLGFRQFVGVDGSVRMLDQARKTGIYQDLKENLLGQGPLPLEAEMFDIAVIVGALSVGQVPVDVVEDLWKATKPGGYVCMTTRANLDNMDYKAELERVIKGMEEEGKWSCLVQKEVKDWERAVQEKESGYISGTIYLYKKCIS